MMQAMMEKGIEVVVVFGIVLGTLLAVLGLIGLWKLPDAYTRMHAMTPLATLGLMAIVGAVFLYTWTQGEPQWGLWLILVFVWMTNPVSAHMLGRAARSAGVPHATMNPPERERTPGQDEQPSSLEREQTERVRGKGS